MGLLNTDAIMDEISPLFSRAKRGKGEINAILEENGLSLEESIIELKNVMENTSDQHLKAKILDLVLNLHGVKDKKEIPTIPNITFIFPESSPRFLSPGSASEIIVVPESEKEI